MSHENDIIGLTETKLFHFHRIFKTGVEEGVEANPLWIRHYSAAAKQ